MKLNKIEVREEPVAPDCSADLYMSITDEGGGYRIFSLSLPLVEERPGEWNVFFRKGAFVKLINYTNSVDVEGVYVVVEDIFDFVGEREAGLINESGEIDTWTSEMQSLLIYSFYEVFMNPDKYIDPEELK